MAAAPVVKPIDNCLPNFIERGNVVQWKRYLFYMLGYCDTYHDFHTSRLSDNSNEQEQITGIVKSIGSLPNYILDVIDKMDKTVNWRENIYDYIDTHRKKVGFTFENAMFEMFTQVNNNTMINTGMNLYESQIKSYLREIFLLTETQEIDRMILPNELVKIDTVVPNLCLLELTVPAIVYKPPTIEKFTNFLHKIYGVAPGQTLKFVEDTASFPREMVVTGRFTKIVTTQTYWDPAGLSGFTPQDDAQRKQPANTPVAAPSFISASPYTTTQTKIFNSKLELKPSFLIKVLTAPYLSSIAPEPKIS